MFSNAVARDIGKTSDLGYFSSHALIRPPCICYRFRRDYACLRVCESSYISFQQCGWPSVGDPPGIRRGIVRSGMAIGKVARRLQVGPTLKALKVLQRRPNAPGVHGHRKFKQVSIYGQQLIEKQKLKFQFMLTEKALRRAYSDARRKKGSTGETLLQILDQRLDATIFRSGVVRSVLAARQLITHRHVFVNGKRVDKPSFQSLHLMSSLSRRRLCSSDSSTRDSASPRP